MDLAMAQRLVDRRKAAGLSQEALAAQLGVSRQAVSKWKRSEFSPDTDNLIALAALYDVSLDELLYGEAASDVDTSADDDVDANNSVESEGAESSTEHVDSDGKPLVDISLARGIHVIDPNKGEEVHVGWNGIHVANERKGEEVHVGPGGLHIDTLEDDGHSVHTNADGTVTVKANSEACWLFVKVTESANLDDFITYAIATGWTELEAGVYYREVPASAADQTFSVLAGDAVTVKSDVTRAMLETAKTDAPTLTFKAYAIQKDHFATADAAWAEVSK